MRKRERKQPHEMTEEERLAHEQYVRELTAKNQQTVKKVCTVLWCMAMVAWALLLALDFIHQAAPSKILFHGVAAAITAVLAVRRIVDFFAKKNEDTDA